jgi:hypothetical protein
MAGRHDQESVVRILNNREITVRGWDGQLDEVALACQIDDELEEFRPKDEKKGERESPCLNPRIK